MIETLTVHFFEHAEEYRSGQQRVVHDERLVTEGRDERFEAFLVVSVGDVRVVAFFPLQYARGQGHDGVGQGCVRARPLRDVDAEVLDRLADVELEEVG